eukprot:SAG31_NODE_1015_length_10366_cov_47.726113_7_plen_101_part_00
MGRYQAQLGRLNLQRAAVDRPEAQLAPPMSERADWLYDSIFGFLKSPEWTVPIMDYIDKNCTVRVPPSIIDVGPSRRPQRRGTQLRRPDCLTMIICFPGL